MVSMPRHFGTEVELINAQVAWTFPIIFSMTNSSMICSCFCSDARMNPFVFLVFARVKLRILDAVFDSLRLDVTKQLVVSGESAGPR